MAEEFLDWYAGLGLVLAQSINTTGVTQFATRCLIESYAHSNRTFIPILKTLVAMNAMITESIFDTMTMPFPKPVEKNTAVGMQKLLIPFYDRKRTVSVDEIVRLEGSGNYTNFFLKDGTRMLVSRTLKEYETLLDGGAFVRVHKSCIVNLEFVRKFFVKKEGELELADGQQVKISRRRAQVFIDRMNDFKPVAVS